MSIEWTAVGNFGDVIGQAAAKFGMRTAFQDERRQVSFEEYAREIDLIAGALHARGIKPGDRIAILSQNRIEVAVLLGLCRAGLVPMPINWRLGPQELERLLADAEPTALFVDDSHAVTLTTLPISASVPELVVSLDSTCFADVSYRSLIEEQRAFLPVPSAGSDVCCLLYTSGTTGLPKGVLLTHRAAIENCRDVARDAFAFTTRDVTLMAMPLFHVGGIWYFLFPSFVSGSRTIIRARFEAGDVVETMRREEITNAHLVPTMLVDILNHPALPEAAVSLRLIVYAGSSLPEEVLRRAMRTLPECHFAQAYGSTEAGSITALSPSDHARAALLPACAHLLRSCGRPIGDVAVRIDRQLGSDQGGIGEILVRSPKLMAGYWRRPEETAEKMDGEWLRTGDLGHVDSDGFVYIVDRKNDMVISGGENIFPLEVEEVLRRHDSIADAAVFGVPDARWVERLVAAVVLHPGHSVEAADILRFARSHLVGYKSPKTVLILTRLPRTGLGKVLRKDLRAQYAELEASGSEGSPE